VGKFPAAIYWYSMARYFVRYYAAGFRAFESYQMQELPNLQGYELAQHLSYIDSSVPIGI
jgi:hypothetical protein